MSEPGYITIVDWERFQHYKNRNPAWIKTYTELLSSDEYLRLTSHRRALLHGLWLMYAMSHGRIAHDTLIISRRLSMKVTRNDLEALEAAGYLALPKALEANHASTALANGYQSASNFASTEKEKEREKEKPASPAVASYADAASELDRLLGKAGRQGDK